MKHFNSVGLKTKKPTNKFISWLFAEAGGFEPPVPLRVRQFSKLVVSATHPNFLEPAFSLKCGANIERLFELCKLLQRFFRKRTFPLACFYSLYYFVINAK